MVSFKSLALALSLTPLCLAAQESPFHGGQWAMQFGGNSNLFSLGVLHFSSARSAWILDLSNSVTVLNATNTDKFGGTSTSADQQFINLDARLGKRHYHTGNAKVVSFQTLALEGEGAIRWSTSPPVTFVKPHGMPGSTPNSAGDICSRQA